MLIKYQIEDNILISRLTENYGFQIKNLDFIPMGDSAYSYRVNCFCGQRFYLKLFDHLNEMQKRGIERLSYYLPLTWNLYHQRLLKNITYPIKTLNGDFQLTFNGITTVIFNFIEGETLAKEHPFSDEILEDVAKSVAFIQRITSFIDHTVIPKESFDISFHSNLTKCISVLESPSNLDSRVKQVLREIIFVKKEQILVSLKLVCELSNAAILDSKEYVLCHGDIWGGNIIRHNNQLYFIDWESVIVAPPEYNMFAFIGKGFDVFFSSYEKHLGQSVTINIDLLRFYSYRAHLRNLTNWLMNIIYRNTEEAQNENDLEMIRDHCLNRFEPIESNILTVNAILQKKIAN